jgi:hypothetical protein
MNKISKLVGILAILITTTALAERVEFGKLTISNDFVVASNVLIKGTTTHSNTVTIASGNVVLGTNAVSFGTNNITMYGGVLNGTNGIYWYYNLTNYWLLITP